MKLKMRTMAILLIAILMISAMPFAISVMAKKEQETIQVWWLEDATRLHGDGTSKQSWINGRIPDSEYRDYIEFAVHGKSYHALEVEWVYNYWPLENFESSPLVIANGKFAFWARYTSAYSGLPILDKLRGKLTICEADEGYTADGSYVQYSYAFGTAEEVSEFYTAIETDEPGMWLVGITYYTVHGQTPTT